ncbi:HupE/UreJ family protein [Falsiroseomonas oryziterrae]|uniref:HupE/UreJ family protein n=1 Tax=Falsiroseomonas oryziterrae TaxID=2911368 RepID=UPI001F47CE51|nr:HupE/UreJ family protein [Roseomonas sp. NPKOSM-4]
MKRIRPALIEIFAPLPALAHPGGLDAHGVAAGCLHPLGGWDHTAALLAVGLFAGLSGGRARWLLPAGFLAGIALGGLLGVGQVPFPAIEAAILASIIVLGSLVASAVPMALGLAVPLVTGFGLVHGHAHGMEASTGGLSFVVGFVFSTLRLHATGLLLAATPHRCRAVRLAGDGGAMLASVMAVLALMPL